MNPETSYVLSHSKRLNLTQQQSKIMHGLHIT